MNVCPFLCNSELLIPLLLLIAVITLLLLLLLLILLLLMQLIAKIITAVHFQVRVCNIRPFHTMSVCCGAFSLWIKKWCLLTCVSTSNIRNNKIWFNQKHDIVAVLFLIHKNKGILYCASIKYGGWQMAYLIGSNKKSQYGRRILLD